jgi:hypothetical protein
MLKSIEAAARVVSDLPADAFLSDGVSAAAFFTGVRTVVMDGIAHLIFYVAQPGPTGDVEYAAVARLAAPEMRAAAVLTNAALQIAKGPSAIDRPAN